MGLFMKRVICFTIGLFMMICSNMLCLADVTPFPGDAKETVVGIAWRPDTDSEFFTNICRAVEEASGTWVLLDQVSCYGGRGVIILDKSGDVQPGEAIIVKYRA